MLHGSQGSNGLFGPFAYTIVAADVAANADATARSHATGETESTARTASTVKSIFDGLRDIATSIIARPGHAHTA